MHSILGHAFDGGDGMKKIKKATKKVAVKVDYEGMGTCIDATFLVNGKPVFAIVSCSPETNHQTSAVIALAETALALNLLESK